MWRWLLCMVCCTALSAFGQAPISKEERKPYYTLSVTPKQRDQVYELIDAMGTRRWYELLFRKKRLDKLGEEIESVHPVRFAGIIFADSHLKECMGRIRESSLKWSRFLDGFSKKMSRYDKQNRIMPYLPGLAFVTKSDRKQLKRYVKAKDWEGFLNYLIDK